MLLCTSFLPLLQRGAPAWWQVVGRVATPDVGEGQVAILSPHAGYLCRVTTVPYFPGLHSTPVELPVPGYRVLE